MVFFDTTTQFNLDFAATAAWIIIRKRKKAIVAAVDAYHTVISGAVVFTSTNIVQSRQKFPKWSLNHTWTSGHFKLLLQWQWQWHSVDTNLLSYLNGKQMFEKKEKKNWKKYKPTKPTERSRQTCKRLCDHFFANCVVFLFRIYWSWYFSCVCVAFNHLDDMLLNFIHIVVYLCSFVAHNIEAMKATRH